MSISAAQQSDSVIHTHTHIYTHIYVYIYTHTHILLILFSTMVCPRLDIVLCAIHRTLLSTHSKCNSWHLLTPNSQPIPLPSPSPWQSEVCSPCVWVLDSQNLTKKWKHLQDRVRDLVLLDHIGEKKPQQPSSELNPYSSQTGRELIIGHCC